MDNINDEIENVPRSELIALSEIRFDVEHNFSNRFDRQLIIRTSNAQLKSNIIDARSQEAKRLALNMMWSAQIILSHHDLNWEE